MDDTNTPIIMENISFKKAIDTTGFTFIIPSVSVGNVGQLTVDLLIASYGFEKFATVWDPAIIPLVGPDPFLKDSADICTACELYVNERLKIVALQLRSSIEYKLALDFLKKLRRYIISLKFKEVIILTSSFAHELHRVNSSHFRYITNCDVMKKNLISIDIPPMELTDNDTYIIYGSGFATKLYDLLNDSMNTTLIMKYTSEGDNRPDALQMLNTLSDAIETLKSTESPHINYPYSWRFVFGNPPPVGIY